MSLANLSHDKKIAEQLIGLLRSERSVHAFLFSGGSKKTRRDIGFELAKAVLCEKSEGDSCGSCPACKRFVSGNSPDFVFLEKPEGKTQISVDQIASLRKRLTYKPFGKRYAVLIEGAELLSAGAQNKLLKTLEEPPGGSVIILLAEKREQLFSTVVSRCAVYELKEPVESPNPLLEKAAADLLFLILSGAPYYKCKNILEPVLNLKEEKRENALEFILLFEKKALDECKKGGGGKAAAYAAELAFAAEKYIKQGQNVSYSLKQMCLGLRTRR